MNKNGHYLAVFGAASQVLIPIGFVVSQLRLHSAVSGMDFNHSVDVQQVISGLHTTTSQMGRAFDFFLWALGFAMLTLLLFIIAITRLRYRRNWAFWFSVHPWCLLDLPRPPWHAIRTVPSNLCIDSPSGVCAIHLSSSDNDSIKLS